MAAFSSDSHWMNLRNQGSSNICVQAAGAHHHGRGKSGTDLNQHLQVSYRPRCQQHYWMQQRLR
eukprot:scaffold310555_cov18-Tisochrysis_lutea.AAC.1